VSGAHTSHDCAAHLHTCAAACMDLHSQCAASLRMCVRAHRRRGSQRTPRTRRTPDEARRGSQRSEDTQLLPQPRASVPGINEALKLAAFNVLPGNPEDGQYMLQSSCPSIGAKAVVRAWVRVCVAVLLRLDDATAVACAFTPCAIVGPSHGRSPETSLIHATCAQMMLLECCAAGFMFLYLRARGECV
jgi:hypothetical protein